MMGKTVNFHGWRRAMIMSSRKPRAYFYQFSPLLILELRHIMNGFNAGRLDAKVAFRAWQRALDDEIGDEAFRQFAVREFSTIMAAITRGEDDVMLARDVGGTIFLRVNGKEVRVCR